MPTVKMKATKMSDAKVSFISLVERGANRIPFKIVKQEKAMSSVPNYSGLDLATLFTRKAEKTTPAQAELVAVATLKGEDFDSIKSQLAEQGILVEDLIDMEDGSVVFKQADAEGEGEVIRINEHVALVVKGFEPYPMAMEINGEDFITVCKAQGAFPGLGTLLSILADGVMQTVEKADNHTDVVEDIAAMFDEAKAYATSLLSSLPSVAFKAEFIVPVAKEAADETPPAAEPVIVADETPPADEPPVEAVVEKTETPPAEVVVEKAEDGLTEEKVSAIVLSQVGAAMESLTKKMEDMMASLTGTVSDSLKAVESKVSQVEEIAKSASETAASIVVPGSNTDDHDVKKNDRGYVQRDIDTAFMPHVRKQARK